MELYEYIYTGEWFNFSKEEKKVAITSLMLPAENNLTSSRAENAQMAGIRVENSKKKIQHPPR